MRTSRPVARDEVATPASRKRNSSLDAISDLAGSLSHDFNNLLMVMRNCGVFLREDLDPGDPCQEYVTDLLEAAERAEHLVSQLQAFGRTQMLRPDYVKPAELIRGLSETLRSMVPEDVDLRLSIAAYMDLRKARIEGTTWESVGHIEMQSEPGRGTQNKVYLPLASLENVRP